MVVSLIKKIAYEKATKTKIDGYEDMVEYLKAYWCHKYNLPDNDSRLLDKNFDELLLEYYVDIFKTDESFVKKFEIELNGGEALDDDEDWFKKEMGDSYVAPKNVTIEEGDVTIFADNYETG